jgi:hypothetical protein
MAKEYRKLKLKIPRTRQRRPGGKKRLTQNFQSQPRWQTRLLSVLALTMLGGSAAAILTFGWISFLFILNPQQIIWLNEYLPQAKKIGSKNQNLPKTLAEIESILKQKNLVAGEILSLTNQQSDQKNNQNKQKPNLFLMPILQRVDNCDSDCQKLLEIRVYQQSKEIEFNLQSQIHYDLVKTLTVTGPTQFFVKSPWGKNVSQPVSDKEQENQKENNLPLTSIQMFSDSSLPGFWFNLQGKYQQGDEAIAYGEIVHYNPQLRSLQQLLTWKNPTGKLPQWQQITGNSTAELVIDQTVDLEPRLQVYKIKSGELVNNSVYLEEINLQPVMKGSGYEQSLLMARNGMWTPANAWLTSIQKEIKKPLPEYVQGQLDLIRLYSQRTKTNADQTWASPARQVQTALMDGRLEQGLNALESAPYSGQEIYNLLQFDSSNLWNISTVALRINPQRRAALAWVYLMLAVQRGDEYANFWLAKQPKISEENLFYLRDLLAKLKNEAQTSHPSQIIGGVEKISRINYSDWLPINGEQEIVIEDNQVLYQVNVSAFHNGINWLSYPFTNLPIPRNPSSLFWRSVLGIGEDPQIQIVIWLANGEQQVTTASIKALQMQNRDLKLLVAGETFLGGENIDLQPKPLAFTQAALQWVQPLPISVAAVEARNPQAIQTALPKIWRSLQKSGDIKTNSVPDFKELKQKMAYWPVQMVDITNDGNSDLALTISSEVIAFLNTSNDENLGSFVENKPDRTIIFSHQGQIIYNDFGANPPQKLTAIAKLNSNQSLGLLVNKGGKYELRRWSETNQRLE